MITMNNNLRRLLLFICAGLIFALPLVMIVQKTVDHLDYRVAVMETGPESAVTQTGINALKTEKFLILCLFSVSFLGILTLFFLMSRGLFLAQTSIQSLKAAEKKARLMEAVIRHANDGVIITGADFQKPGPEILYVNEAFSRITGYERDEVIGENPRFLQGHDTDQNVLKELRRSLEKGEPFKGELKNYSKQGKAYWLDISVVPVFDEAGTITHFAAIERDITERKVFEKELMITKEAAEVGSRAKGDFLANMSHELRTPMNGIIGLTELLLDMQMDEEQEELVSAVYSSSRNLLILLNDLLDLSKIEAGELTLEKIPFDLRKAIRSTKELLAPLASRRGVVLENTINPIVPDYIMGDPGRFQQILNNLISNAIKFTEVGYVRVDVTTTRGAHDESVLRLRVEDTGIGIPEDKREAVFSKFTQADVSTARKYGGTGLGLSITKELVEMMGGEISFESVEGKGTTFYVEIPFIEARNKPKSQDEEEERTACIRTDANVMVVDDHPVNLLFMRKVLKKLGFLSVDEAQSGQGALNLLKDKQYDLIFMDCQMPEMDGFEASEHIRDMEDYENQVKIIAVTADAMKGAKEKCLDAGMNDYVSKPVDIEKLSCVLEQWLPGEDTQEDYVQAALEAASMAETFEEPEQTTTGPADNIDEDEALPVMDWARLALFTDGDADEEAELIEMFETYAQESLETLKVSLEDGEAETWKKAAHKLKGSAANLGADRLSAACLKGENAMEASKTEKEEILAAILDAYEQTTNALETHNKAEA